MHPILVTVASILSSEVEKYVLKLHEVAVRRISRELKLNSWTSILRVGENCSEDILRIKNENPCVLLVNVATGGVEELVLKLVEELKLPIILIANGKSNSFAASLEVKAYLKEKGLKIPVIFHKNFEESFLRDLSEALIVEEAAEAFNNLKIGFIGNPSPWLLTTYLSLNEFKVRGWKAKFIDLEDVVDRFNSTLDSNALKLAKNFLEKVSEVRGVSERGLKDSFKLYLALKSIIGEMELKYVTVRCFDLIEKLGVTSCLALSLLNDEGVVAGCEGDLGALLTMVLMRKLSSKPVWMANIASMDRKRNSLLLAHCTISTKLIEDGVEISTHYESSKPLGVHGSVLSGTVTLARIGGEKLNMFLAAIGEVSGSNFREEDVCRCQVEVNLRGRVDEFIDSVPGNHVVMAYGDLSKTLRNICDKLSMNFILIRER